MGVGTLISHSSEKKKKKHLKKLNNKIFRLVKENNRVNETRNSGDRKLQKNY